MADKKGIISIHGKEYMTVARRVELAHEDGSLEGVKSEVLSNDPVVIRVTAIIKGKEYQGTSAANPTKSIEKQSPYEVAETSALGRALGFAGYGIVEGIASADEMHKATYNKPVPEPYEDNGHTRVPTEDFVDEPEEEPTCEVCGAPVTERQGVGKSGKKYHALFCTQDKTHVKWLPV